MKGFIKFLNTSRITNAIVMFIGLMAGGWVFNHINAWLGITLIALITLNIIYKLTTFFKNL